MNRAAISLGLLAFLLGSCASTPRSTTAPPAPSRPHILMIVADDLGWGDVGFHGSEIATPHLDALAAGGVRLEQFYVQPVCSPTRAALLTGRYPLRLGLQCGVVRPWSSHGLPLDERTLANALAEAGYATALCGKWHLGHAREEYLPTRRGFEQQYGLYNGAIDYWTHRRDGGLDWHANDRALREEGYATELLANAAIERLAAHDHARPLFLYLPFNAPHSPLQAPEDSLAAYAHIADKQRRTYAAMVASLDSAIGRILRALPEHGFAAEETLVFFCSDNGGLRQFGSNGELRGGKGQLYEGGLRVPAVISWSGHLDAGGIVNEPLHAVDLYPTLLRLAGASAAQAKPIDGQDCWPVLAAGAKTPRELLVHNVTPWSGALRSGAWKLIQNGAVPANATEGPPQDTWELFHIGEDPGERNDRSRDEPERMRAMRERLEALRREAAPPVLSPNVAPEGFRAPEVWGES
jgi:arylsulfatase A-like enzyme